MLVTVGTGQPMVLANSGTVQPRSTNSSRRYSPGGNASAGVVELVIADWFQGCTATPFSPPPSGSLAIRLDLDFHRNLHHSLEQRFKLGMQFGLVLVAPQDHSHGVGLLRIGIIPSVDVPYD